MPLISACCCFKSLKAGSRAAALFTLISGIINVLIGIIILIKLHELDRTLEWNEKYTFLPPGILVFMYIELLVNLITIGLAFVLWVGINRAYEGKKLINVWVYSMMACRIYEVLLGIYILAWLGKHRFGDILYVAPEIIVVVTYWGFCIGILIFSIVCVVSYWQDLLNDLCGKENRIRYFHKLINIRSAALKGGGGMLTPSLRSYYTSRERLAASQQSLVRSHATAPSTMSVPSGKF